MDLGKTVIEQLQEYAKDRGGTADRSQPLTHEYSQDNLHLRCGIEELATHSVTLTKLELRFTNRTPITFSKLKSRGDWLQSKITYLLEGLRLVEADQTKQKLQLRTDSPRNNGLSISYYEILMGCDGVLSLTRMQFEKATRQRSFLPFTLTKEGFQKLINDLHKCWEI